MEQSRANTISMVYSNLQKAAEKQQRYELVEEYGALSTQFKAVGGTGGRVADLFEMVSKDLDEIIPQSNEVVKAQGDRGGQRALKWGETVAKIQKSILDRYIKKGDEAFAGKNFYVCQACGFIYVGNEPPAICAACKAPSNRFEKIK